MINFVSWLIVLTAIAMPIGLLLEQHNQNSSVNVPLARPRNLELKETDTINVHFQAWLAGSSFYSLENMMKELNAEQINQKNDAGVSTPRFHVTALVNNDTKTKIPESDHFKLIRLPYKAKEMMPLQKDMTGSVPQLMQRITKLVQKSEVNSEILEKEIKGAKPDIVVGLPIPIDGMVAKYLNAEEMMFLFYLPESVTAMASDLPAQYTYANSFLTPLESLARASPFNLLRRSIMLIANPIYNAILHYNFVQNQNDFLPEFRDNFDPSNVLVWGHGVEPILDSVQRPNNMAHWNPQSRFDSKNNHGETEVLDLDPRFKTHIDKFDTIILVSFSSVFELEDLANLVEALASDQSIGVVFTIKDKASMLMVTAYRHANILAVTKVPQKQILALPKTRLLITNAGGKSVIESIYYGVPILSFPVAVDQLGLSATIEQNGMGIYSNIKNKPDVISGQIKRIIKDEPLYKQNVENVSKLMTFEEVRGGKDTVYWVEYVAKFGTNHLNNPTHKMSYIAIYDLDIKLIAASFVLIVVYAILFLFKFLYTKQL